MALASSTRLCVVIKFSKNIRSRLSAHKVEVTFLFCLREKLANFVGVDFVDAH